MPWPIRMVLQIALISLPFHIYLFMRCTTAVSSTFGFSKMKIRLGFLSLLLWIYILPLVFYFGYSPQLFINSDVVHWQDYFFHYPFWWAMIIMMELLPFYLFLDILNLLNYFIKSTSQQRWMKIQSIAKILLSLFFLIFIPYKTWHDTNTIRTSKINISLPEHARALNGTQLVLFADLQVDRYTTGTKNQNFLEKAEALYPDLFFFAGDIVTGGQDFINEALKSACDLKAKAGRLAVLGDHDFWSNPDKITDGLTNCGWSFLKDSHKLILYKGKRILVTGITHIYSKHISQANLGQLLDTAPQADYKILLVHQPAKFIIEAAAAKGYNLVLAGHTHGGQIVTHIFGWQLTPSRFETPYFQGHYKLKDTDIIVTDGIGLTLAPFRYFAPAEISEINLVAK